MAGKVIIIGAGIAGLECAYILLKNGYDVSVLEHDKQAGGCLQTFRRNGNNFDTGFHYVGGLDESQPLNRLFGYFNLLDLPWHQLDRDCFDEVVIGDQSYPFAQGHENFVKQLTYYFPKQKDNLSRFTQILKSTGEHLFDAFLPHEAEQFYSESLFAKSAYQFLEDITDDPLLRQVLSATSLKMELNKNLPLYTFAQLHNSFIDSAWRLQGGGAQLIEHLVEDISRMGGSVTCMQTVTSIVERQGKVIGVRVNKDTFLSADYVIFSAHPQEMLRLLIDSETIRNIYRKRISNLKDTFGMFTANIVLKPHTVPYLNRNLYIHKPATDLWNVDTSEVRSVLVNYYLPTDDSSYSPAVDILTPMRWQQVARWANTRQGHRGEDYVRFKEQVTDQCLELVDKRLPHLKQAIEHIYTSTPLSYNYYTLTHHGTAFGIQKDWQSPITTILTPKTPIQNLYMTGQNLNLHGILGTTMTSFLTCAELIGINKLRKDLKLK